MSTFPQWWNNRYINDELNLIFTGLYLWLCDEYAKEKYGV